MPSRILLSCHCGSVRGHVDLVSPRQYNRVVCYCDDCQAFAHWLDRLDMFDQWGGTDICQVPPARMQIEAGADEIRCLRLSPKGLHRWYARCCRTAAGNTLTPNFAFVGIPRVFMSNAADGRSPDAVMGPPVGYILGRFARGGVPPHADACSSLGLIAGTVRKMLGWRLSGAGTPSPFFDSKSKVPMVTPEVLTLSEREAVRQRVREFAATA